MDWPVLSGTDREICEQVFVWARGRFVWTPDEVTQGLVDHWPSPREIAEACDARGGVLHDDCDGFAAMCRHALRANGVKSRLALCWVEDGGYHAVCEAGGLVLDNRQVAVVKAQDLDRVGYVWDKMSGYSIGDDWTNVAPR